MISTLETSGVLTKSEKAKVREWYFETFGRELIIRKGCQNCWHDAVIELYSEQKKGQIRMKNGAVINHNGKILTCVNITQKEISELFETYKHYFYGM